MLATVAASTAVAEADPVASAMPIYASKCASCHGVTLAGGFGPRLTGQAFHDRWAARSRADLAKYIETAMPPNDPGRVSVADGEALANLLAAANSLPKEPKGESGAASGVADPAAAAVIEFAQRPANKDARYLAEIARRESLVQKISPITDGALSNPSAADWPAWRRDADTLGYSPLKQINRRNAGQLTPAWTASLSPGTNGVAPLVHDGVMFLNASGKVMALDAATGDLLWEHEGSARNTGAVPHTQPRSMALYGDKLFVPTLDGHVVALEARSGKVLWDHELFKPETKFQLTTAPVIARGKVIQGVAGCSQSNYLGGCFIAALDVQTGEEAWRFHTIAHPGVPGGESWNGAELAERTGGSVWTPGTYDPDLNLVYFGTAQTYRPGILLRPDAGRGETNDALFTDSTLAFDPDTGKMVWHYQHMPAEVWDLDWAFERMLMTVPTPQGPRKIVLTGGKIALFDALDAKTGQYLFSFDLGMQNLVQSVDPVTGRKQVNPAARFGPGTSALVCPGVIGARNWPATAYDPVNGLLFIPMNQNCDKIGMAQADVPFAGPLTVEPVDKAEAKGLYGRVVAFDLRKRRIVWTNDRRAAQVSATLATAGGLLFEGSNDRTFRALDSGTGKTLWQAPLNEIPNGFPISYAVGSNQYVAIVAGGGTPLAYFTQEKVPEVPRATGARSIWVFKLK